MSYFIGKTDRGQEIFGYDFDSPEVKAVGEFELEIVGSTSKIDRDGEVISVDGWDLKNFKKNPVVLPSHMYYEPAIGKAKVSIKESQLIFKIEFPEAGINPVADVYRGLYKGGFMKGSSVGFRPIEWQWGTGEKDPRRTFLKQELLEISLVSIPANPEALVTEKGIDSAVKAGCLSSREIKTLEDFISRNSKKETSVWTLSGAGDDPVNEKGTDAVESLEDEENTDPHYMDLFIKSVEESFHPPVSVDTGEDLESIKQSIKESFNNKGD